MSKIYENTGKPPRSTTIKLGIEFANGRKAIHEYTSDQLRWTRTGDDWDVAKFWRAA